MRLKELLSEGIAIKTGKTINWAHKKITTLKDKDIVWKGRVISTFDISYNYLTDLKDCPKRVGRLEARYNHLTSLEGAPKVIEGWCLLNANRLTNLHNIHKIIHEIGEGIDLRDNPIESQVLGLLNIKGNFKIGNLFNVVNPESKAKPWNQVMVLLNDNFIEKNNKDIIDAQEALLDAGFEDFARL